VVKLKTKYKNFGINSNMTILNLIVLKGNNILVNIIMGSLIGKIPKLYFNCPTLKCPEASSSSSSSHFFCFLVVVVTR
jgi:hypothetical protein